MKKQIFTTPCHPACLCVNELLRFFTVSTLYFMGPLKHMEIWLSILFFSTYVLRNVPLRTCVIVMAMVIFFKLVFTCPCTTPEETLLHCWLYLCLQICIQFFVVIPIDNRLLKICRCYVCKCCVGGQRRCCKFVAVPRVVTVFFLKVVDRKDGITLV